MKTKQQLVGSLLAALLLVGPVIRLASGGGVTFTYDSAGRLLLANFGAGHSASYAYDNAGNLLLSSAPAPGIIIGPLVAGQLTLSWPALPSGFVLQKSATLGPTASWSTVTARTNQVGNLITVIIAVGPESDFYRLQQ
jgi:YD repeat-containing protein